MLGEKFLLLFLFMFSSFSQSEVLIIKEHKTYIVPENEQWVI